MNVLILGGTGEARELAAALAGEPAYRVISSLAGRTTAPLALPGEVRSGGFGGADGLAAYLRSQRVDAVVDATHPFADEISRSARVACDQTRVPRVQLVRPQWQAGPGDRWLHADSLPEAARALLQQPDARAGRVFLACGRKGLDAFPSNAGIHST